ncbi:thymidine kinase 2, mitochondrial [Elysia marginata]|uniref:Thymidine kinase 2, mitochondrial n=1 Tax=Elysia marginata TaxID=1093978 RepID=A0AAV4IKD6_9GAST|nr:thymidine kinase 2, mitochondrial [Elysia marginata]
MEMRCYRRLPRISYKEHIANAEVRRKIENAIGPHIDLLTIVRQRKLKWYGYTTRSTGLAKTIMQVAANGGSRDETGLERANLAEKNDSYALLFSISTEMLKVKLHSRGISSEICVLTLIWRELQLGVEIKPVTSLKSYTQGAKFHSFRPTLRRVCGSPTKATEESRSKYPRLINTCCTCSAKMKPVNGGGYQQMDLEGTKLQSKMSPRNITWFDFLTGSGKANLDLIVYLRADPATCYERLRKRSRKEEAGVPISLIESLHKLHDEWLLEKKYPVPAPVLVLDANHDLDTMKEVYNFKRQEILCGYS